MKAEFEHIITAANDSFLMKIVERQKRPILKGAWHYHPDIEITLTLKGRGKRFVGNDISNYIEGDLVMLGKNLPHCWLTRSQSKQIVIQIPESFYLGSFLKRPEVKEINLLFNKSIKGICFYGKTKEGATNRIHGLLELKGYSKLIALLDLLHYLSVSEEFKLLTPIEYNPELNLLKSERIQKIYSFILNNYMNDITLGDASELLNMTKTSLCRFLKSNTQKSFSKILNEVKIAHVCKKLIETDMQVMEICYESGYNDVTNFNRRFKELMNLTPLEYRRRFSKKA